MNVPDDNTITDEVKIDLNMLHVLVLDWVDEGVDGIDVVAVDKCAPGERVVKILKEMAKPARLRHTVGDGALLSLGVRAGNYGLTLGGQGEKVVPKKHSVAGGGPMGV